MRSIIWIVDVISPSGAKGHFSKADLPLLIWPTSSTPLLDREAKL